MVEKVSIKEIFVNILRSLFGSFALVGMMAITIWGVNFAIEKYGWEDITLQGVIDENIGYASILIAVFALIFINIVYIAVPRRSCIIIKFLNCSLKSGADIAQGYVIGVTAFIISGYFLGMDVVINTAFFFLVIGTLIINPIFHHIETTGKNIDKFFSAIIAALYIVGIVLFSDIYKG
ncbi:TPA: hypothetical protein ACQYCW_004554 [Vibrio parahaemolyticus]